MTIRIECDETGRPVKVFQYGNEVKDWGVDSTYDAEHSNEWVKIGINRLGSYLADRLFAEAKKLKGKLVNANRKDPPHLSFLVGKTEGLEIATDILQEALGEKDKIPRAYWGFEKDNN